MRLALCLVLGGQAAAMLVLSGHRAPGAPSGHVPFMAVAAIEVTGAALMLGAPRLRLGYVLLALSLVLGSIVHVLHGETPPASFVVYLASILLAALMRPARAAVAGEAHG
jgi:hypothetical protein